MFATKRGQEEMHKVVGDEGAIDKRMEEIATLLDGSSIPKEMLTFFAMTTIGLLAIGTMAQTNLIVLGRARLWHLVIEGVIIGLGLGMFVTSTFLPISLMGLGVSLVMGGMFLLDMSKAATMGGTK